jgi:hypothetical protein
MYFFLLKNYNKNRIHSARGAKDVEISLNGRMIFKGEMIHQLMEKFEFDLLKKWKNQWFFNLDYFIYY